MISEDVSQSRTFTLHGLSWGSEGRAHFGSPEKECTHRSAYWITATFAHAWVLGQGALRQV